MKAKFIGVIILLVFLVLFAVQNVQPLTVKFLFWEIGTSAVLSIFISFLIGFLIGWIIGLTKPEKK
ncbi:MAG: lipopolysaccharide assembly protein LapA domain-containing protein [Thermodesulfobacteriota bacterium]